MVEKFDGYWMIVITISLVLAVFSASSVGWDKVEGNDPDGIVDFARQQRADIQYDQAHMKIKIDSLQIEINELQDALSETKRFLCKVNYNDDLEIQGYELAERRLTECRNIGK